MPPPKKEFIGCGKSYRVSKGGNLIELEYCTVPESNGVLMFKNGVLNGVSGNPSKADAEKFAKLIGSKKSEIPL